MSLAAGPIPQVESILFTNRIELNRTELTYTFVKYISKVYCTQELFVTEIAFNPCIVIFHAENLLLITWPPFLFNKLPIQPSLGSSPLNSKEGLVRKGRRISADNLKRSVNPARRTKVLTKDEK